MAPAQEVPAVMMTRPSKKEYLLLSDLDDTLLGDDDALERFRKFYEDTCRARFTLAYASGRFYESIEEDIRTTDLPEPDFVIGGVGSDIRRFPDGESDPEWIEQMSDGWSAGKIREILKDDARLRLQPEALQSDFKVSYYWHDATAEQINALREGLAEAGLRVNIIYSSSRDLDFLPANVDKGTAGVFVAKKLGISNNRVISFGNSGNDETLLKHGFNGTVVANAHGELKDIARKSHAYLSPLAHADGVQDGIEHWMDRLEEN